MNTAYRVVVSIQVTTEYYYENGIQYSVTQKKQKTINIQYSLGKIFYPIKSYSVFTCVKKLVFSILFSIQLYQLADIQYSIQYSVLMIYG